MPRVAKNFFKLPVGVVVVDQNDAGQFPKVGSLGVVGDTFKQGAAGIVWCGGSRGDERGVVVNDVHGGDPFRHKNAPKAGSPDACGCRCGVGFRCG